MSDVDFEALAQGFKPKYDHTELRERLDDLSYHECRWAWGDYKREFNRLGGSDEEYESVKAVYNEYVGRAAKDRWQVRTSIPGDLFLRSANDEDLEALVASAFVAHIKDTPEANIVFSGATGVGKSVAAAIVVRSRNVRCCWYAARDLCEKVRQWPLGKGEPEDIERAKGAGLLVLDDLGLESADHGTLLSIIEARYWKALPTITTTGLGTDELIEKYGEAFYRRLLNCGPHKGRLVLG